MPELSNPKHEAFALHVSRGLTPPQAAAAAGFKKSGARAAASRLLQNVTVRDRIAELRQAVTASVLQLAITERDERLIALQEVRRSA